MPPDAQDLALLERAQQLHLQVALQVAHLVQEERRARGLLEEADLAGLRAGEGPLLVPEQLGFQDALGQGGHVDRVEGPVAPLALVMEGAGHQLLARAALPVDEHGGAGGRHLVHDAEDVVHGAVRAHDVVEAEAVAELLLQHPVLAHEAAPLQRALHHEQHLVALERLRQVVEGSLAHRLHRAVDRAVGGHQDHAEPGLDPEQLPEEHRCRSGRAS